MMELQIKSLKLNYMQEYLLRLNDYFLNQVTNSFVDTNPCEEIVRRTAIKLDPFFIVQA